MEFDTLLYEVSDHVATITINRPERRNAMSWTVMTELRQAFRAAGTEPDVRVVVLTGAGDKAFSAGADLAGMSAGAGFAELHDARGEMARLFREVWELGKPTVARVRGYALAGGFGAALMCDIVIASEDAVFGTPEIDVGLWPMMITAPMLRSMPPKVALELMMTGRRVTAAEGAQIGFVNKVVPGEGLDAAVAEVTSVLAGKPPAVMRLGRNAFYLALDQDVAHALPMLQAGLTLVTQTEDSAEGILAFQEKRSPEWRGR